LWLNEAKSGQKYMSGVVEIDGNTYKIVVFKNKYKEQDKHPDYKIFASTPRDQSSDQKADDFPDDIPF